MVSAVSQLSNLVDAATLPAADKRLWGSFKIQLNPQTSVKREILSVGGGELEGNNTISVRNINLLIIGDTLVVADGVRGWGLSLKFVDSIKDWDGKRVLC